MLWEILWRNKNSFSLTFCVLFSLACIIWQRNPFAQGIGYFGRMADRISGALNSGLRFTGTLWVELDKYRELEKRYEQAQLTLEEYRLEKDKYDLLKFENEKLREALSFPAGERHPELRAEVLGVRLNTLSPRIIINMGSDDGVAPLMPVIARAHDSDGNLIRCVVGVVAAADSGSAVVQPLIHPSFRLGVRIEESGEWAILSGNSGRSNEALLTYLTTDVRPEQAVLTHSEIEVKPQILVRTSGEGGVFPEGIPVGRIRGEGPREGEFKTAYVEPLAPVSELDIVSVILKKPEPWSRNWDQRERWEEHLETEFGPPVYPESGARQPEPRPEPQRRPEPEPAPETQEPETETETGPAEEPRPERREPRRIQNPNPPGA